MEKDNSQFNLNDSLKNALKQIIKEEPENDKLFIKMEKLLNSKTQKN